MATVATLAVPCIFLCSQAKAPKEFMILDSTTSWIQPKDTSVLLHRIRGNFHLHGAFSRQRAGRASGEGSWGAWCWLGQCWLPSCLPLWPPVSPAAFLELTQVVHADAPHLWSSCAQKEITQLVCSSTGCLEDGVFGGDGLTSSVTLLTSVEMSASEY